MKRMKAKRMTFTGVFAALIFVMTFMFHIPIGFGGGYMHIGDAAVYLAACLLPHPLAYLASAIGAGLSDALTPGAAAWILPTAIIKPLCCIAFKGGGKLLRKRNIAALFIAAFISAAGYAAATALLSGSIATAVTEMPFSFLQSAASSVCFLVIAAAFDKSGLSNMIKLGENEA